MQQKKSGSRPRRPKKNMPVINVTIDRLNEDGVGVGHVDGKPILVPGALPGEKIRATVEHEGQRHQAGRLARVLVPNPDRVPAACSHADACQGCLLIGLNYPAQLKWKEDSVRAELQRYDALRPVPVVPIWAAPQAFGYRCHAKLVMARERGKVKIGLYRRGSHDVVDIGNCPLHHPLINRIVEVVREEIDRQQIWIYDPLKGRGLLRYLLVRVSPTHQKALVTFVTAKREYREVTSLAKWLQRKVPEVISVQENVNGSAGNVIFGRETLKIIGAPDLIDQIGDLRLRLGPTSFLQVNHPQAARIYELVRDWAALKPGENAIDVYCGIGGIALNLARDAGGVIGIEVVPEAVRNARENARMNGRNNCRFLDGDAADLLGDLVGEIPPGSVAVVNPPRKGCAPEVLKALAELAPRSLIYVSCSPDTLARDLDLLSRQGLRALEVQPVDMFPQTPHVESVVRLEPITAQATKTPKKSRIKERP